VEIDTEEVSEKVDSGSYFEESKKFYDLLYHSPMSERSCYVIVILVGLLIFWISVQSFLSIFPLRPNIPFIISSRDVFEELPMMEKLSYGGEDKNQAVMRYLIRNYVERREFYNFFKPENMETNFYNIRYHSARDVLVEYRDFLKPESPSSPYSVLGNETSRSVKINSIRWSSNGPNSYSAVVDFTEQLTGKRKSFSPEWTAELSYTYIPYEVAQDIEGLSLTNFFLIAWEVYSNPEKYTREGKFKIKPMTFTVSSYTTKPKLSSGQ
jgi:type IV secretory pathway component VirB8